MRGGWIIRVICCVITVTHHPPRPPVPPPQNIQHQYGKIKTTTTTHSHKSRKSKFENEKNNNQIQMVSTLSLTTHPIPSSTPRYSTNLDHQKGKIRKQQQQNIDDVNTITCHPHHHQFHPPQIFDKLRILFGRSSPISSHRRIFLSSQ